MVFEFASLACLLKAVLFMLFDLGNTPLVLFLVETARRAAISARAQRAERMERAERDA
jgi:hypothetical protein